MTARDYVRWTTSPALDASEKDWRIWSVYNFGLLRRQLRDTFEGAAALARDNARRLLEHEDADTARTREALVFKTLSCMAVIIPDNCYGHNEARGCSA